MNEDSKLLDIKISKLRDIMSYLNYKVFKDFNTITATPILEIPNEIFNKIKKIYELLLELYYNVLECMDLIDSMKLILNRSYFSENNKNNRYYILSLVGKFQLAAKRLQAGVNYLKSIMSKYNDITYSNITIDKLHDSINLNNLNERSPVKIQNRPLNLQKILNMKFDKYLSSSFSSDTLYLLDNGKYDIYTSYGPRKIGKTIPFHSQRNRPGWYSKCNPRDPSNYKFVKKIAEKAGIDIKNLDYNKICNRLAKQYDILYRNATFGNDACQNTKSYYEEDLNDIPTRNIITIDDKGFSKVTCLTINDYLKYYESKVLDKLPFVNPYNNTTPWDNPRFLYIYDTLNNLKIDNNFKYVYQILLNLGYNEKDLNELTRKEIFAYLRDNVHEHEPEIKHMTNIDPEEIYKNKISGYETILNGPTSDLKKLIGWYKYIGKFYSEIIMELPNGDQTVEIKQTYIPQNVQITDKDFIVLMKLLSDDKDIVVNITNPNNMQQVPYTTLGVPYTTLGVPYTTLGVREALQQKREHRIKVNRPALHYFLDIILSRKGEVAFNEFKRNMGITEREIENEYREHPRNFYQIKELFNEYNIEFPD